MLFQAFFTKRWRRNAYHEGIPVLVGEQDTDCLFSISSFFSLVEISHTDTLLIAPYILTLPDPLPGMRF